MILLMLEFTESASGRTNRCPEKSAVFSSSAVVEDGRSETTIRNLGEIHSAGSARCRTDSALCLARLSDGAFTIDRKADMTCYRRRGITP